MSIYSTGLTALRAAQLGIATTGHNIANVNTTGYRRQEIIQGTQVPVSTGAGFIGQGVNVETVQRIYSEFVERQVSQNESQTAYLGQYMDNIQQIDNVMGDRSTGFSNAIQKFFQSWNDLASNPTSLAAREAVLGAANTVADNVDTMGTYLQGLQNSANSEIQSLVARINSYAQNIATLNDKIATLNGTSSQQPNDLLDQRDQVVSDLSKLVGVTVLKEPSTGAYNVYLGASYQLVSGTYVNGITAQASQYDPSRIEVYDSAGTTQLTGNAVASGQLGGVLDFRSQVLDAAQNSMGRIAISLATNVNALHTAGWDLTGTAGGNFFNSMTSMPQLLGSSGNTGTYSVASASVTNANALTTENYTLSFSAGSWTVRRNSDNQAVTATVAGSGLGPYTLTFDGLQVNVTATAAPGGTDTFLLKPTQLAASSMSVAVTSASRIAAATGASWTGQTLDNSNALAIAALQSNNTLIGGAATLEGGYANLVGQIGNKTDEVKINQKAQSTLLDQAKLAQQGASGVNLDEEAASLIRYQQAYQAAAQVLKSATTMFDTLLSLGG